MISIRKIATYFVIGALALSGRATIARAAEIPIAGITLTLDELYKNTKDANQEITQFLLAETSLDHTLAFANASNYVNIRSKANEKSEILGKLYQNSAATILSTKGDWYQVKSGNVTGYIKSEFLTTGEKADKLSKTVGNQIATVNTTTLKVRDKASQDSEIITLIPDGDNLEVLKEVDGWVKISLDENTTGYVSEDYVKITTEYEEAVSIEEEKERLEAEAQVELEEQSRISVTSYSKSSTHNSTSSSSKTSSNSSTSKNSSTSNTSSNNSDHSSSETTTSNSSSLRSKIVNYALKFEGNPYVWGGTSLTNGADCSGFLQTVFRDYGISIPRTSRTQASGGRTVSMNNLQPGDFVFYTRNGTINHVALYIGNGKVISASSPSTGIRITAYNYRPPYKAVSYIN